MLRRHDGPAGVGVSDDFHTWDREALGKRVREVWVEWAKKQPDPKPSWLVTWDDLDEGDKEVDRQIGETIAKESNAKLEADFDELEKDYDELDLDNKHLRRVDVSLKEQIIGLEAEVRRVRSERIATSGLLAFALVALGFLCWYAWTLPVPVESPPPPAPVECPPVEECEECAECAVEVPPTVGMSPHGYHSADGQLHDWPSPGDYEPDQFVEDCHAVCQVPSTFDRNAEPGRVLLVDPAHLVCVCFHRSGTWPVERYIGWERIW
jgi:hypothetical protein